MTLQAGVAPQQHDITVSFSKLLNGKGLIFFSFLPLPSKSLFLQHPGSPFLLNLRLSDCNKLQWKYCSVFPETNQA